MVVPFQNLDVGWLSLGRSRSQSVVIARITQESILAHFTNSAKLLYDLAIKTLSICITQYWMYLLTSTQPNAILRLCIHLADLPTPLLSHLTILLWLHLSFSWSYPEAQSIVVMPLLDKEICKYWTKARQNEIRMFWVSCALNHN